MGRLLQNTWIYRLHNEPNNRTLPFGRKKHRKRNYLNSVSLKECAVEKHERTSARYWNWRKRVLTRDHFTCTVCGNAGREVKLEAHHIKPWFDFPAKRFMLDNGITLCFDCHNSKHPWRFDKPTKIIQQFNLKTQELIKKRLSKMPSWMIK